MGFVHEPFVLEGCLPGALPGALLEPCLGCPLQFTEGCPLPCESGLERQISRANNSLPSPAGMLPAGLSAGLQSPASTVRFFLVQCFHRRKLVRCVFPHRQAEVIAGVQETRSKPWAEGDAPSSALCPGVA